jgi:hypothetical protein
MPGSVTTPGRPSTCDSLLWRIAFRLANNVGIRNHDYGSMVGWQCIPLPRLRRRPGERRRTARGRCGSLILHRNGLAPYTPCRSPGALANVCHGVNDGAAALLLASPEAAKNMVSYRSRASLAERPQVCHRA